MPITVNCFTPVIFRLPIEDGEYIVVSSTGYITVLNFEVKNKRWHGDSKDDYWNKYITHWKTII